MELRRTTTKSEPFVSLPCRLLLISQAVIDIRNTYATLYDRIMKNYDKLMNPCGVHTGMKWDTMY